MNVFLKTFSPFQVLTHSHIKFSITSRYQTQADNPNIAYQRDSSPKINHQNESSVII